MTNKKVEKSEKQILEEINNKMTKMLAILAIQGKTDDEKITILKKVGLTSEETGLYVGIADTAVRKRKAWNQK